MKKLIVFFVFILIVTLAACSQTAESAAEEPAIDSAVYDTGKTVFQANCSACHSTTSQDTLVGPSMLGIAERAGKMADGLDARGYIEQSILEPGAFVNEGFQNLMPATYANSLSSEDLNALVEYLLTFK